MFWLYVIIYFILSILISISIGNFLDKLMRGKFLAAINLVIPDYTPILGKKISNDPYVNSVLNDVRVKNDVDKIKNAIAKFLSLIFSLIFVFFISSLYFSDRKETGSEKIDVEEKIQTKNIEEGAEQLFVQFGPFGDLFNGSLTPLLTFATFTGLLITIIMQHMQMRATLAELQMSRIEMSESTDALQEQVKNSQAQKFDSNFYSMLQLHMEVAESLKKNKVLIDNEYKHFNLLSDKWSGFEAPDELRSFFLINYQMLKFIRKNEYDETISSAEAKQYANILRALLNDDLYGLIFINCTNNIFYKYKNLIEHYGFLEHFVFSKFKSRSLLKKISYYEKKVFGDCVNLNNVFLNKRDEINRLISKDIIFSIEKIKEIFDIDGHTSSINYPEMRKYERYFPEKYSDAIILVKKIVKLENEINDCLSKITTSVLFDDQKFIDNLSEGNNFVILNILNFNFDEYLKLIEEFFELVGNWYGYLGFIPSHIGKIKDEVYK